MEEGQGRAWKLPLLTLQEEVGFSFDPRCDFWLFSAWAFYFYFFT